MARMIVADRDYVIGKYKLSKLKEVRIPHQALLILNPNKPVQIEDMVAEERRIDAGGPAPGDVLKVSPDLVVRESCAALPIPRARSSGRR